MLRINDRSLLVINGIDDEKFVRILGVTAMIMARKGMISIDGAGVEGNGVTAVFASSLCVFCRIEWIGAPRREPSHSQFFFSFCIFLH